MTKFPLPHQTQVPLQSCPHEFLPFSFPLFKLLFHFLVQTVPKQYREGRISYIDALFSAPERTQHEKKMDSSFVNRPELEL